MRIILLVQKTVGLLDTAVDRTFFNNFKISEKLFLRIGFASNLMLSFSFNCNVDIVTTGLLGKGKVLKSQQSPGLSLSRK